MSGDESDAVEDWRPSPGDGTRKRTRITKACDFCKRRKVKCDGTTPERPRCTTCTSFDLDCTFATLSKKRGPPKKPRNSLTDPSLTSSVSASPTLIASSSAIPSASASTASSSAIGSSPSAASPSDDEDEEDDDGNPVEPLSEWLEKLTLDPLHPRQSSNDNSAVRMLKAALQTRQLEHAYKHATKSRRPEFWQVHPWEMEELSIYAHSLSTHTLTFPDPDLLHELTNLYFAHSNVYTPILHRPMFEKALADGLHLRDTGFGGVVLLVCAIASRYTHDPRVFLRGAPTQSAGWKWYSQVEMVRKSPLAPPRLYDVQQYALASVFLVGCSAPHVTWNMIGLGVRMCLDVSAHRKKVYKATGPDQIIEEQWKRAFWGLVNMDRIASNEMGRVVAVLDEDIDAPLPCECDDEYFVSPDRTRYFVQPPEKPSLVAYVNIMISLRSIQLKAQRSLFSTLREKSYDYEVKVVAELNADLDRWRDAVPSHLRWETALAAADDHPIFFRQCTASWTVYHYARIIIHRPFAVGLRRNTPLGMASVEVCYNSAREIARMFRDLLKRDSGPFGLHMFSAFTAASVLLLMKWTQDREGDGTLESPSEQDLKHVYTCMNVIKTSEPRWYLAGRLWDILYELVTVVQALPSTPSHSHTPDGTADGSTGAAAGNSSSSFLAQTADITPSRAATAAHNTSMHLADAPSSDTATNCATTSFLTTDAALPSPRNTAIGPQIDFGGHAPLPVWAHRELSAFGDHPAAAGALAAPISASSTPLDPSSSASQQSADPWTPLGSFLADQNILGAMYSENTLPGYANAFSFAFGGQHDAGLSAAAQEELGMAMGAASSSAMVTDETILGWAAGFSDAL